MITRKELGFVNAWANKVPYPGKVYCEDAIDKLEQSLELYKKEYANIKYNISFSNNEEIELEIQSKNICHMLGIDYKNLTGDFFKTFRKNILDYDPDNYISSYQLLELLLQNKGKVLAYDYSNTARALNYYKVSIKCDIFNKLANLIDFNYGCINFDKDEYLKNNPDDRFASKSAKFLYMASDEIVSPYFMMGLRKDEAFLGYSTVVDEDDMGASKSDTYIVETLIAPESVDKLFRGQEVIIPTQILTDTSGILQKTEATAMQKIQILKDYKALIDNYKLVNNINIYSDYLSLLMSEERNNLTKEKV